MTRHHKLDFAAAALLVGSIAIASLGCHGKSPADQSAAGSAESSRARVTAVKPERKTIRRSFTQPGQIDAFEQARLFAKIPAYVEKYFVDIGDLVTGPRYDQDGKTIKRGQLLVELSAPELEHELQQKKALVAQAGADVEQAQAAIKVAKSDVVRAEAKLNEAIAVVDRLDAEYQRWNSEYKRVSDLVARSAVTQKLADETKAQLMAAEAGQKEAEAKVQSARSAIAASQAQLEKSMADEVAVRARRQVAEAEEARVAALNNYLNIEAPFDGTISARNADTGYFAQSGGGNQSPPLYVLVRTDPVRVFVDLPETEASLANAGDHAVVHVQSLSGRQFTGTVTRTSWALDPSARTLHTEVDIPNPSGELRPGMYADVTIDLAESKDAIVVPAVAVVIQENRNWCFVVENDKAVRKPVSIGIKSGSEVEITSGLNGDETVVASKGASLTDGQPVEIVDPTAAK